MQIQVQQILTRSLNKLGIVGASTTPNTNDNALALEALKALIHGFINAGTFGELDDIIPNGVTTYNASENQRIVHDSTVAVSLPTTLPLSYNASDYGFSAVTYDNNLVRPPMDLSVIEDVNTDTATTATYLYDNNLRTWTDINTLLSTSACPLALRDENGLTCLLALHLADEFGQQPTDLMVAAAAKFKGALATNFSQAGKLLTPGDYD